LGLGVLGLGVEPIGEEAEFRRRCEQRRRAAQEAGRNFGSSFDWVVSPKTEIFRLLRARVRMLSLHELVPGGPDAGGALPGSVEEIPNGSPR